MRQPGNGARNANRAGGTRHATAPPPRARSFHAGNLLVTIGALKRPFPASARSRERSTALASDLSRECGKRFDPQVSAFDLDQLHVENQRRIGWNDPACAAFAVAHVGWNDQSPLPADLHSLHAFLPAADDAPFAQQETKGNIAVAR